MTVIVAAKDKDKIWVGCDSQHTGDRLVYHLKSQPKIWQPEFDAHSIMGVSGELRDMNILSTVETWLDEFPANQKEMDLKYVIRHIVPKMFQELEHYDRIYVENGIKRMQSTVLYAYKNKAYAILWDGSVAEVDDMAAIGCGLEFAYGAWESLKCKKMPVKDKVIQCVKAACNKDAYVGYPIIVRNTETDRVSVIEK